MEHLIQVCKECLDENLIRATISNGRKSGSLRKVTVKPYLVEKRICFQFSAYGEKQVRHKNLEAEEALEEIRSYMKGEFKQIELVTQNEQVTAMVSKKEKATVKRKKQNVENGLPSCLSHNREKQYILKEGNPIPFLVDLGVQTKEGKTVAKMHHKFRQINRFLELIQDVLPALNGKKEITIVDFGCGKSYLTFAIYYFLVEQKEYKVNMMGLDQKEDVIAYCNQLRDKYGYENLRFLVGDIQSYEKQGSVDLVVALHACDTATDFALAKAVEWNAKVILSVPCCQHEANRQIQSGLLAPVLKYGILKERISALLTDGIRANLLEECGYEAQVLEFIDPSNTPKNLMIRAVRGDRKGVDTGIQKLQESLNLHLTLSRLFEKEKEKCSKSLDR